MDQHGRVFWSGTRLLDEFLQQRPYHGDRPDRIRSEPVHDAGFLRDVRLSQIDPQNRRGPSAPRHIAAGVTVYGSDIDTLLAMARASHDRSREIESALANTLAPPEVLPGILVAAYRHEVHASCIGLLDGRLKSR